MCLLYAFQTNDEQVIGGTRHQNGLGFNSTDSVFCSSLAEQYKSKGRLTEKQLARLKGVLPKYWKQIPALKPLPNLPTPAKKEEDQTKRATLEGSTVILSFPFDLSIIATVKALPKRKWNATAKRWELPISLDTIETVKELGFELDKGIQSWYEEKTKKADGTGLIIPGLRATLYPFQREGIDFIDSREGRALIADEQGLGKTLQALGWLQLRPESLPAIVICPASLKINWAREAMRFTDLEPVIISGGKKKVFQPCIPGKRDGNLYIINYDIIHESQVCEACEGKKKIKGVKCPTCKGKGKIVNLHKDLESLEAKTMILDECHYTKSNSAGRTVAAKVLAKQVKHVITLSGTPIVNRPVEFYNALRITDPDCIPSWNQFTSRYCGKTYNGFGWDVSGASNTEELHKRLTRTVMLRRLKKNVLPQLPPKVRTVVPLPINLKEYERMISQAERELAEAGTSAAHLVIIEKAKQAVVKLKMDSALEWIQDYIDNDEKLVVFAEHKSVIEQVTKHFDSAAVTIYGGTSQEARQKAVDRFQKDPSCKILVGSKAAKEGLTLTAARATAFLELWWTPGDHSQAEDRVHRIGQEADSVTAYYLLAADTIEETIAELIDSKRGVLSQVLDGKKVEERSMLTELMDRILNRKEK